MSTSSNSGHRDALLTLEAAGQVLVVLRPGRDPGRDIPQRRAATDRCCVQRRGECSSPPALIAVPLIRPRQTVTIFAYGVTSSGKTHTMQGTKAEPGVIPRVVRVRRVFFARYPTAPFLTPLYPPITNIH